MLFSLPKLRPTTSNFKVRLALRAATSSLPSARLATAVQLYLLLHRLVQRQFGVDYFAALSDMAPSDARDLAHHFQRTAEAMARREHELRREHGNLLYDEAFGLLQPEPSACRVAAQLSAAIVSAQHDNSVQSDTTRVVVGLLQQAFPFFADAHSAVQTAQGHFEELADVFESDAQTLMGCVAEVDRSEALAPLKRAPAWLSSRNPPFAR